MIEGPGRLSSALRDRYTIERELGAGGMATVYLAQDLKHGRKVAIKVLRPELAAVIGAERFLREIKTIANLQHPHILGLIDSGEVQGTAYYVMPYVEGESLRDRLTREKQLPVDEAVRIATEVAHALDYAHRHGVIHRDIKPENILLHDGSALVADFGIALAASKAGDTRMTETGMSLGTPHYMSPEQAMGEREITARSDVYALGCVTYEMLVGEPPFTGPTAQAIVARMMTEEPRPPRVQRKTVPPEVEDAVLVALAKLPADRFATALGFAQALASPGVAASRARTAPRPGRSVRRSISLPLAIGLAGLALLLGLLPSLLRGRAPPAGAGLRTRVQFPPGQELLVGRFPVLANPPDGGGLLYTGPGAGARTQFWFRAWSRLGAERLARSLDEGCCAVYSPSGDTIAYLAAPRQLNLLPLSGGLPTTLSDSGLLSVTDWGGGLDWAPDGWIYAGGTQGLLRIDPRSGARELVAPHDTGRGDVAFLWPQVLPGGKGVLLTVVGTRSSDPEQASIGVADLGTGQVRILVPGVRAIYASTGHLLVAKPNGVLWAVPFDVGSRQVTGAARALADTVALRFGAAGPGGVDLALDRHGTLAYISGTISSYQVVWVDRTGQWEPLAEGLHAPLINGLHLSADGTRLAVAFSGEDRSLAVWIQPTVRGAGLRLTSSGTFMRPRWSPGERQITFVGVQRLSGEVGLHLFDIEAEGGRTARRLATSEPRHIGGFAWSPDGTWLLYRTDDQEPGNGDIMAIRPGQDTTPRTLVATAAEELAPVISPDGRWLAYSSNQSGRREIYVSPFPATEQARYQVSTNGGITPLWSRDGRELFFVDAGQNLVAVPIAAGPGFQAGSPRLLFSTAGYFIQPYQPQFDVSPDGKRFVMIRADAADQLGVVVVTDFLRELEQRMASP